MKATTKVKVVFHLVGDIVEEADWTVEQLVMGKHLEWFQSSLLKYPDAEWSVRRSEYGPQAH